VNDIRRALEDPPRKIAQNSGVEGAVVVNKVREGKAISSAPRVPM
jgi:chaperonin GroEL